MAKGVWCATMTSDTRASARVEGRGAQVLFLKLLKWRSAANVGLSWGFGRVDDSLERGVFKEGLFRPRAHQVYMTVWVLTDIGREAECIAGKANCLNEWHPCIYSVNFSVLNYLECFPTQPFECPDTLPTSELWGPDLSDIVLTEEGLARAKHALKLNRID